MPELDFKTAVWLAVAICGLFALAGGLLASSLGSNAIVRRIEVANVVMFLCLSIRLLTAKDIGNLGYAVVWSLWAGAALVFISALRLLSEQPAPDRQLLAQWGAMVGSMFAAALLVERPQWIALVASGCLFWAMASCFWNAWRIPDPRLRKIRFWLVGTFAIGTMVVAAHVPLRLSELINARQAMAHSGATYGFMLVLWVAANVGLMLLVQAKLALRVAELAQSDELTGLLNRRGLFERLAEENLQGGASSSGVLMLFDIDHFKSINDRFGHATGDEVLRWFATQMRTHTRPNDCLVRIGGEEFVWLVRGGSLMQGTALAEKLRSGLSDRMRCAVVQPPLRVTVSVGLAEFSGSLTDLKASLARADEALYTAKHAGRDRVRCWNPHDVPAVVPIASQRREDAAVV